LKEGAPEALWQERIPDWGCVIQLNTERKPLDDIRVRRAIGLLIDQDSLAVGYSGDPMFGIPGTGIFTENFGLPKEEIIKLMGWDKPMSERIAEAKRLMAEAGYPDGGFTLSMVSSGSASNAYVGVNLVLAETLRRELGIESEVRGLAATELIARLDQGAYDVVTGKLLSGYDPVLTQVYFKSGEYNNRSKYSNPRIDQIYDELDRTLDPEKRRDMMWEVERALLTDLPVLPTGCFIKKFMVHYPHVKNMRYNNTSYSNIVRLEDVWMDESLRIK